MSDDSLMPTFLSDMMLCTGPCLTIGLLAFSINMLIWAWPLLSWVAGSRILIHMVSGMLAQEKSVWQGLDMSPHNAPSTRAKPSTYLRWFARPNIVAVEPYYELPISITTIRSLFHVRMGSHSLPLEQGRLGKCSAPRFWQRCTFFSTRAVGDELRCSFDCPHFQGLWQEHAQLFHNALGAMRSLM